jgi:hypothetical protein
MGFLSFAVGSLPAALATGRFFDYTAVCYGKSITKGVDTLDLSG